MTYGEFLIRQEIKLKGNGMRCPSKFKPVHQEPVKILRAKTKEGNKGKSDP